MFSAATASNLKHTNFRTKFNRAPNLLVLWLGPQVSHELTRSFWLAMATQLGRAGHESVASDREATATVARPEVDDF